MKSHTHIYIHILKRWNMKCFLLSYWPCLCICWKYPDRSSTQKNLFKWLVKNWFTQLFRWLVNWFTQLFRYLLDLFTQKALKSHEKGRRTTHFSIYIYIALMPICLSCHYYVNEIIQFGEVYFCFWCSDNMFVHNEYLMDVWKIYIFSFKFAYCKAYLY